MTPAVGQYWRDIPGNVVLKILHITVDEDQKSKPEYVRCACISRGKVFGIEEMKSETLTTRMIEPTCERPYANQPRFVLAAGIRRHWYQFKYRKVK